MRYQHFMCLIAGLLFSGAALAQAQPAYNMTDSSFSSCSGLFYDSGGPAGGNSGYQPNENYVWTVCPTGNDLMRFNFSQFNLDTGDVMNVYNGPSTAAPVLGNYQWPNQLLGGIQATVNNPSGCLTFEFISDGSAQGTGWAATFECVDPCQPFQSVLTANAPAFNSTGYEIDICPGEAVTLTAIGDYVNNNLYYTQSDALSEFQWDWGDGGLDTSQTATHTYDNTGYYGILLNIVDTLYCDNSNAIDIIVRVATEPAMSSTVAQDTICFGETNLLTGTANTTTYSQTWGNILADSLQIPDIVGVPYETTVTLNLFNPGQTLNNIQDLLGICVNMEHSYLGDLNISIECPTGQTATLVAFGSGGGSTFLGEPVDNDGANPIPAVGYDYCWVPVVNSPTYGTFGQTSNTFFYAYTDVIGNTYSNHPYLPSGSYTAEDPLTQLVGCELNGDWTITVVDNLGIDNGHIFSWYLDLNPALFPNPLVTFTPGELSNNFNIDNSFLSFTDSTATVQPLINGGQADYVYIIEDDFGCTWYDTLSFYVQSLSHVDCFVCYDPHMSGTDVTCNGAADGVIIAEANDSLGIHNFPYTFQWLGPTGAVVRTENNVFLIDTLTNVGPGTYTVIVTDSAGCVSSNQFTIVEPPPMFASIDSTRDATCFEKCDGFAELTVSGGSAPYQYHWSNNFHSLANGQLCEGTTTVTVTDQGFCEIILSVTVGQPDSIELTTTADTIVCIGGTASFSAAATGGIGGPYNFVWSNMGAPSTIANQNIQPTHPELIGVYAIDGDGCQSAPDTISIQMYDPMQILTDATDTLCPGQSALIGAAILGGNGDYYYQWDQGLPGDSAHWVSPTVSTTYNLTVTDGCTTPAVTVSMDVLMAIMPNTSYHTNLDSGCVPMTVNFFIDNHSPLNVYTWTFGDNLNLETRAQTHNHLYPFPGCYDVALQTRTPEGCVEHINDICRIVAYPQPVADFEFNPLTPTNIQSEISVYDKSFGAASWEYDMGTGDIVEDQQQFRYNFPDSGSFAVTLTIISEGGCIDTLTQIVDVAFEPTLYVPNAFTPDGDGLNDVFQPIGIGYHDNAYALRVYNRWGELIFTSRDPMVGWNGQGRGRSLVPGGVYTYMIRYTNVKGSDFENVRGHVTVIR